jgi:hypothetical protein
VLFKDSPSAQARPWHLEFYLSICASLLLFSAFAPVHLIGSALYGALAIISGPLLIALARALHAATRPRRTTRGQR